MHDNRWEGEKEEDKEKEDKPKREEKNKMKVEKAEKTKLPSAQKVGCFIWISSTVASAVSSKSTVCSDSFRLTRWGIRSFL